MTQQEYEIIKNMAKEYGLEFKKKSEITEKDKIVDLGKTVEALDLYIKQIRKENNDTEN